MTLPFYPIPDLCWCGCNEITWNGKRFIKGHSSRGDNNPSKKEGVGEKISKSKIDIKRPDMSGENHPLYGKIGVNNHNYGRKNTKETIELMSQIKMGDKNPAYGKISHRKGKVGIYSKETIEKMRIAKMGKKLHLGYRNSNEIKLKMSNAKIGKLPTHGYSKRSYYESPLQGEVCFRSSYELAYAKYLDDNKILWMYEIETFDLGYCNYTPDFFLIKDNKFIEIKGYMYKKSQDKINKFLEQYKLNFEILYKEDLIKLGIKL